MISAGLVVIGMGFLAGAGGDDPAPGTKAPPPEKSPKEEKPEMGKTAPDFEIKDQEGKPVRLSAFRAKKAVLLAFYPKDFTGG